MQIEIKGLKDERFQRPLQLITNLFYEESQVRLKDFPEAQMVAEFLVEEKDRLEVSLTLKDKNSGSAYTASSTKVVLYFDVKAAFKQLKNAV